MPRNVTIKNLAEVIAAKAARPAVMKPQKVDGKWRKPKMSARDIARKRKECIMQGREWKWDIPHKIVEKAVPFKGKLRDLRRKEKLVEIERCMKRMPKLVAEYRERERKRRAERAGKVTTGLVQVMFKAADKPGITTR